MNLNTVRMKQEWSNDFFKSMCIRGILRYCAKFNSLYFRANNTNITNFMLKMGFEKDFSSLEQYYINR